MKIEFTDLTLDGVQKRVEDWLDQNWDAERGCRKGQSTFNKQSWFTMVRDAGLAVPTWSTDWFGLGLKPALTSICYMGTPNSFIQLSLLT